MRCPMARYCRVLVIVDEFTRERLALNVDMSICGRQVAIDDRHLNFIH